MYGNPQGDPITQLDPGFRQPVALLIYVAKDNRDEDFLSPLAGYTYPENSCFATKTAVEQQTIGAYQDALRADVSVSQGLGGAVGDFTSKARYGNVKCILHLSHSHRHIVCVHNFTLKCHCLAVSLSRYFASASLVAMDT